MAKPFVKFPGGKRDHAVISLITKLMTETNYDTYLEPMIGGGSVFFALEISELLKDRTVILGDADDQLIKLYEAVRDQPEATHKKAMKEAELIRDTTPAQRKVIYNTTRDLFNLGPAHAGTQLFLRHAVFNGLFRRNKKGELNTPPRDHLEKLSIPPLGELLECSRALKSATELLDWDFRQYDEELFVGLGYLVYLDPPYDGDGGFREYTAEGFSQDDQVALIKTAAEWHERGATVVYSNANTPFIQQTLEAEWPAATIHRVTAKRSIAASGDRTDAPEVIAYAV